MAKYTVKHRVSHNGKDYDAGKTIDLTDDEAAALLEAGAIEGSAAKKGKGSDEKPAE